MAIVRFAPNTIHLGGEVTIVNDVPVGPVVAAVAITDNTLANPTVVTTTTPHGLVTGNVVTISGVSTSVPTINSTYTVTVTGASTFTIPVNVTTAGTGGSLVPSSSEVVPGMLIERFTSGGFAYFRPASVVGGARQAIFALNQSMMNRGVGLPSGVAADNYLAGHLVEAAIGKKGSTFWALVATGAPAIAIGDKLQSAGDGTMQKYTSGIPIAVALEALTNVSGANARLRLEVI